MIETKIEGELSRILEIVQADVVHCDAAAHRSPLTAHRSQRVERNVCWTRSTYDHIFQNRVNSGEVPLCVRQTRITPSFHVEGSADWNFLIPVDGALSVFCI